MFLHEIYLLILLTNDFCGRVINWKKIQRRK